MRASRLFVTAAISLTLLSANQARAESPLRTDGGEAITSFAAERTGGDAFFVAMTTSAGATYTSVVDVATADFTAGITSPPSTARKVALARSPGGDLHLAFGSSSGAVTTFVADVGAPPSWQTRSRRESTWREGGVLALAVGTQPVLAMTLPGSVEVGDGAGPRGAFAAPEATGEAVLARHGEGIALVYPARGGARVEYLTGDGRPSGAQATSVPIDMAVAAIALVPVPGGTLIVARPANERVEPTRVVRLGADGTLGPTRTLASGTVGLVADAYAEGGPDVHVLRAEDTQLTDTSWNAIEKSAASDPARAANVASVSPAGPVTGACNERACLYAFVERTSLRTVTVPRNGAAREALVTPPPSSGPGAPLYGPTNACSSGGELGHGTGTVVGSALGLALAAALVRRTVNSRARRR